MLCLIYDPGNSCYVITDHFDLTLWRSSCSQEFSSKMQNANNCPNIFCDIEGKNIAQN